MFVLSPGQGAAFEMQASALRVIGWVRSIRTGFLWPRRSRQRAARGLYTSRYPAEYWMIEPEIRRVEQVAAYPQVFGLDGTLSLS